MKPPCAALAVSVEYSVIFSHAEVHVAVDQAREHAAGPGLLGDAGRGAAGREQRMDFPAFTSTSFFSGALSGNTSVPPRNTKSLMIFL